MKDEAKTLAYCFVFASSFIPPPSSLLLVVVAGGGIVRPAARANRCPTATPLDDDRACPTLAKPIHIWRGSNRLCANAIRKAAVNPLSLGSYESAPTPDRPWPMLTLATNLTLARVGLSGCRSRAPADAGARAKAATVGEWHSSHRVGEGRKRFAPRKICHTLWTLPVERFVPTNGVVCTGWHDWLGFVENLQNTNTNNSLRERKQAPR